MSYMGDSSTSSTFLFYSWALVFKLLTFGSEWELSQCCNIIIII